jgi:hypothetical protein
MSTASQIARVRAAAGAAINSGSDAAGAKAGDRVTRLATVEAAAAAVAETARQAVATAQAAMAAATALRAKMVRGEPEPAGGGSHSPIGHRH